MAKIRDMFSYFSEEQDSLRFLIRWFMFYIKHDDTFEDIEKQIRNSPHPIALPFLDAVLDAINKIEEPKTRELCKDIMVYGTWKVLYGSSFRPVFIEALYNLSAILQELPYEQYRRDPRLWRINHYHKMEEKRKRLRAKS